jgi:serine/threonine protein kinase
MGTVYKAEQVDLQRIVALKVISEEHTKDKDFVDLFIHEARAAAKLNHPNIVQVYDVKRHNEYYYFSMEFVSGGSVQEILNKQKKISADQSVQMVLDAARGLDYAHKKGIIHRDVKPDNLMIAETGMIKIGDMGLARGLEEKSAPRRRPPSSARRTTSRPSRCWGGPPTSGRTSTRWARRRTGCSRGDAVLGARACAILVEQEGPRGRGVDRRALSRSSRSRWRDRGADDGARSRPPATRA